MQDSLEALEEIRASYHSCKSTQARKILKNAFEKKKAYVKARARTEEERAAVEALHLEYLPVESPHASEIS